MVIINKFITPIIWCGASYPLIWLFWAFHSNNLSANPIEFVNRYLGETALKLLLITLAITPLRIITGWKPIVQVRRLIGLLGFFYATLHLSFYIGVEQFFDWGLIFSDLIKRTYISVGFIAFVILIPLGLTSSKAVKKFIGPKKWKLLHQGLYISAFLACVHFFMMRKGIQLEPLYYFGVLGLLFLIRILNYIKFKF